MGLSGSAYLARGYNRLGTFAAIAITWFVFFFAAFALLGPLNARQVSAFIPLTIALAYVLLGLRVGPRYAATGIGIAALTLGGFFLLPHHFFLWMAITGGGALVLAGLWLRKV